MNEKDIEKLEKKIELAKECAEYLDKKHRESYELDYDAFIPDGYNMKKKIKNFEYLKEVLTILTEKGIDVEEKYKIMDDIYLSIDVDHDAYFYFYIEDYGWIYNNYISSVSGINEWLFDTIANVYDLYSGNSSYNYAFGTMSLKGYRRNIENKPKDDYSDRPYTAKQVANAIEKLIEFFTDKENSTRNAIVKDLEYKFNTMKKLIKETEE